MTAQISVLQVIAFGIPGALIFLALGYLVRKIIAQRRVKSAEAKAKEVLQ